MSRRPTPIKQGKGRPPEKGTSHSVKKNVGAAKHNSPRKLGRVDRRPSPR